MARLGVLRSPNVPTPDECPVFPLEEFSLRLSATKAAMAERQLDFLAVYGDREHFATIAFLTGVDPRFEEALLLLDSSGRKLLLLGNECLNYGPDPSTGIEVEPFLDFSLSGQPRSGSRHIREILADFGIGSRTRIGCADWKTLSTEIVGDQTSIEIPAYLVDALRDLTGSRECVVNANAIFVDPGYGLRIRNSAAQIAQFEYAATVTSAGVRDATKALVPGVRERDVERFLDNRGIPLSCHTMVSFGKKVDRGLSSPTDARAAIGDAYVVAYGLRGSLTCRAGAIAHDSAELPPDLRTFYPALLFNYFDVVVAWYQAIAIGVAGGDVFAAADSARDPDLFEFALNPGHFLSLDEWVETPFRSNDVTELASGMVLQSDIIPVPRKRGCYVNIEDGIALADANLRASIKRDFPDMWDRVQQRRAFIEDLGVSLDASVLPLSNTPLWHAPYALTPSLALSA